MELAEAVLGLPAGLAGLPFDVALSGSLPPLPSDLSPRPQPPSSQLGYPLLMAGDGAGLSWLVGGSVPPAVVRVVNWAPCPVQ